MSERILPMRPAHFSGPDMIKLVSIPFSDACEEANDLLLKIV